MSEQVEAIVEEAVKNRAKFEYMVLAVITFFITNFYLTGADIPDTYLIIFYWCMVAYLIIFALDVIAPILSKILTIWSAKHPPPWVEVVLNIAENQMKLVESLPIAVCKFGGEPPHSEKPVTKDYS